MATPQVFRVVIDVIYRDDSPPVDGDELCRYINDNVYLADAPGLIKGHRVAVLTLSSDDGEVLDEQCEDAFRRQDKVH